MAGLNRGKVEQDGTPEDLYFRPLVGMAMPLDGIPAPEPATPDGRLSLRITF